MTLTSLDVGYNQIGAEGAKALAQNTTLALLNISGNQIGVEGTKALAHNSTLTALVISNNQIRAEGVKALIQNTTLTSLSVHSNRIVEKKWLDQLKHTIQQNQQRVIQRRDQFICSSQNLI